MNLVCSLSRQGGRRYSSTGLGGVLGWFHVFGTSIPTAVLTTSPGELSVIGWYQRTITLVGRVG